jgi:hypothetical protein
VGVALRLETISEHVAPGNPGPVARTAVDNVLF